MTYDRIYDEIDDDVQKVYPNFSVLDMLEVDCGSIEKGKYKPVICYAVTPEDSCLVTDFFVVCVDKATSSEFIAVEYDQQYGKEGIWRYI